MSKTSQTKNRILKMLKSGDKRLKDLYPELGLSAPTVSQHLKELLEMQLIEQIDNSHFKNEKYYTLSKEYPSNSNVMIKSELFQKITLGAIVALIAIAGTSIFIYRSDIGLHIGQHSGTLNVLLTDPPHVPLGTQSLNVTYSSLEIHASNSNSSDWININSRGNVDLISLINLSKVIGSIKIPSNESINEVAFNITNASITIQNVSYPVYLTSNRVVGSISNGSFNGNNTDLLVDFSPTIITLYNDNATLFEMVSSVKGLMIGNQDLGPAISNRFAINKKVFDRLNALSGNILITDSNISSIGNYTHINIVVKDASNKSIELNHILIFGNGSIYLNPKYLENQSGGIGISSKTSGMIGSAYPINSSSVISGQMPRYRKMHMNMGGSIGISDARINNSVNTGFGYSDRYNSSWTFNAVHAYNWSSGEINNSWYNNTGNEIVQKGRWMQVNGFFNIPRNLSINSTFGSQMTNNIQSAYRIGVSKERLGVINFIVNSNGTLSEPLYRRYTALNEDQGYMLNPGESVNLSFNGIVTLGSEGQIIVNFTKDTSYKIVVVSLGGSYAQATVNAS